jgi:hypothetical protein
MTKFLLQDTTVKKLIRKTLKENQEGYLFFEKGDEWKKLFFKNGRLTGAASSSKADYLGQYLISYGVIDTEQFEKAYRSGSDPKKSMDEVLKFATPEILKQLIYEKILDTIFIASRWAECAYSVVSEKSKDQKVDVEISAEEISTGLKERVAEFRAVLSVVPTLGSRPKIEHDKIKDHKITDQHEIILNYLAAGKTINEILSIMTPHNYLLFKCFYQLSNMGILVKGTGAPLSREKVIQLVNESHKCKKCAMAISDFTLKFEIELDKDQKDENVEKEDGNYRKDISIYQKLHNEDPENSLYSHCFLKAKSCFIVDFYNNKLSPFAEVGIIDNIEKILNAGQIDKQIYEILKKEGGRSSIKNIIKLMDSRHEIDVLTSVDKMMINGVVKEIEPRTLIDAIKLGRSEYFEKLLNKNEINKLFSADISANLTPLMLSALAGKTCEDMEENFEVKPSYSGSNPVFHDYDMTLLMLASMIGNYEAVEFLLAQHAKTDVHNGNGVTALMLALQNGYDETALLLMNKGADVNAKNQNNYSALMIAASKGMPHIVDFMIKLQVDVNQLNSKGQSALISALRFNHKDIVLSLIAAGTDLNHKDLNGTLPVDHAESPEMVELINKGTKNAKQIKEKLNKKKDDLEISEKDLIKKERQERSGFLAVIFFAMLMVITSAVNVYLLFFPDDRYGFSKESKEVVGQLGMEYCNRFKICRTNVPEDVLAKCHSIGISIMSEFFKNARSCDMELVENCKSCLKAVNCDDFYNIDGSTLSEYCHQCSNACK